MAGALLAAHAGRKVAWLVGGQNQKERAAMLAWWPAAAALVVGTRRHPGTGAVQEPELAIIDEQHRFGVAQRLARGGKAFAAHGKEPHMLMMSATPIPRTLP